MTSINRSTRRTFISNGLAVSGALAFGAPGACFAAAEAQTKQSGGPVSNPAAMQITGPGSLKAHARAKGLLFGAAVERTVAVRQRGGGADRHGSMQHSGGGEFYEDGADASHAYHLLVRGRRRTGCLWRCARDQGARAQPELARAVAHMVQCHGNQGQRASTARRPHLDCCRTRTINEASSSPGTLT